MSVTRTRKAFWKPGEAGPGAGILTERNESYIPPNNPNAGLSLSQQRARLPVFKYRESILYMLEKFQTLVVVGETGSGKSTQIPQYLHEAGWTADGRVVACLQPRRIAAVSVAERVAAERGVALGGEVGYSIRFDERTDAQQTRIKYMTEGMLLRAMMRDPLLARYSVIMLDEAHERTVFLDVIVGLLLKIQRKRKDLRVIVSSATVNAELFRAYFNTNRSGDPAQDSAAILTVEGRTHPVEVLYAAEPVANYVQTTVDTVLAIHESESEGDILAFLTGQDEVDTVVDQLRDRSQKLSGRGREVVVLPMYGGLPQADQMAVFETVPGGMRKVIVATNIAEASVTIPGIVFVVDCGFVKIKGYNSQTGIESLVIAPISKASANQRSGRAGRVQSGKVFRLYQESGFSDILPDATVPEMQRCEVSGVLLQLKALGIDNVLRFPFISPPSAQAVANALQSLFALGGLDEDCKLTEPLGLQLAEFPLPPMQAKMLLASAEHGCTSEAATISAMLQVQSIFLEPPDKRLAARRQKLRFSCKEGDHLSLLNVFNAFVAAGKSAKWCHNHMLNYKSLARATEVRKQLLFALSRHGLRETVADGDDPDAILRCVCAGFFANAARLHMDGTYRSIRGDTPLFIHPSSVLYIEKPPRYVVFNEVVLTSKTYMRDVSAVDPAWLTEVADQFYSYSPMAPQTKRSKG